MSFGHILSDFYPILLLKKYGKRPNFTFSTEIPRSELKGHPQPKKSTDHEMKYYHISLDFFTDTEYGFFFTGSLFASINL